jgi:aminoglycoside phosphotransferase (APT) family kinase protein
MGVPAQRDLEQACSRLAGWLAPRLGDGVSIAKIEMPGATGFSSETLLFDAALPDGDRRGLVAKVEPTNYRVFLDPQFEAQFRVIEALARHSDAPVPPPYWYEPDPSVLGAPFYVLGKVDGLVPQDNPNYSAEGWLKELPPVEQRDVWWSGLEAMARVHATDWKAAGLHFLDRPRRGQPGLEQQLRYYREFLTWASSGDANPLHVRALEWLEVNRPADEPLDLCWGDARISNTIFHGTGAAALLDWEMVTLGNAEQDLAWFMYLDRWFTEVVGNQRLPGFPSREETVARYESVTGRTVRHLEYYDVFAAFRYCVIMTRLADIMVAFEMWPADEEFVGLTMTNQGLELVLP